MSNEFSVIWSELAENQIDLIYEYYLRTASEKVASKVVRGIILAPKKLITKPHIGQVEEYLKLRPIEYRYLTHKHYKLIYSIDEINGFIKIADVFDTRQYPKKMKRATRNESNL